MDRFSEQAIQASHARRPSESAQTHDSPSKRQRQDASSDRPLTEQEQLSRQRFCEYLDRHKHALLLEPQVVEFFRSIAQVHPLYQANPGAAFVYAILRDHAAHFVLWTICSDPRNLPLPDQWTDANAPEAINDFLSACYFDEADGLWMPSERPKQPAAWTEPTRPQSVVGYLTQDHHAGLACCKKGKPVIAVVDVESFFWPQVDVKCFKGHRVKETPWRQMRPNIFTTVAAELLTDFDERDKTATARYNKSQLVHDFRQSVWLSMLAPAQRERQDQLTGKSRWHSCEIFCASLAMSLRLTSFCAIVSIAPRRDRPEEAMLGVPVASQWRQSAKAQGTSCES